jgi:hypothetical protein
MYLVSRAYYLTVIQYTNHLLWHECLYFITEYFLTEDENKNLFSLVASVIPNNG